MEAFSVFAEGDREGCRAVELRRLYVVAIAGIN